MSDQPTVISKDQMMALARYEITFKQFMVDEDLRDDEFIFPEFYQMTLEDLQAALTKMLKEDPTLGDMDRLWFSPMQANAAAFGILESDDEDLILGTEGDTSTDLSGCFPEDIPADLVRDLPLTELDVFLDIWTALNELWFDEDDDTHLSELKQIPGYLEEIELFYENGDKPVEERAFSDRQKENYIGAFRDDYREKSASELELQLCRKFTDELCKKDSETALDIKGYACYGGSRLYDCDWETSRDIMIRLYEMTDNADYANTLGYIYYYGRCNGGEPEYEKAFRMFTVSAANGIYEGAYKLADMYRSGIACKKSPRTARTLYEMVYEDSFKGFIKGAVDGNFADAALRMGGVWMDGIGGRKDPEAALRFYLQAELASNLRLEVSDFFGNVSVAENIRKALEETKAQMPEGYFKEYISAHIPAVFYDMAEGGYRAELSLRVNENSETVVKVARRPRPFQEDPEPLLVTIPELEYCEVVTELEMTALGMRTSFAFDAKKPYRYDFCRWNSEKDRIEFFNDEKPVGWIVCDEYRICRKEA